MGYRLREAMLLEIATVFDMLRDRNESSRRRKPSNPDDEIEE